MRSTSGITCCHFFCSHVFSMPVCRKPTVGDTDTTVSPSSSSTSRSTPCVLGCCGPMLTVIVSVRSSAIDVTLDQLANHMQQRRMNLLHARGAIFLDRDVMFRDLPRATPAPGQRDRDESAIIRRFQRAQDVRRLPARADADR